MKEILVWDNPKIEFERLNINPKLTWKGYGWDKDEILSIYQVTEKDFEILCSDEVEWEESAWRWAEGCILNNSIANKTVNGKLLKCFSSSRKEYKESDEDIDDIEYDHLLDYLCSCLGVSTETNICAITTDIAKYNNITLAELFKKYQTS